MCYLERKPYVLYAREEESPSVPRGSIVFLHIVGVTTLMLF